MLARDRDLKPNHFLNQNDSSSSSKVTFGLSSMIYQTVPTRVHPRKSPISCTNVAILSSEVKILLPFFFVCKDEWLGHNAHRIPWFDQQILIKIFLNELNFCPNQGTHTLGVGAKDLYILVLSKEESQQSVLINQFLIKIL